MDWHPRRGGSAVPFPRLPVGGRGLQSPLQRRSRPAAQLQRAWLTPPHVRLACGAAVQQSQRIARGHPSPAAGSRSRTLRAPARACPCACGVAQARAPTARMWHWSPSRSPSPHDGTGAARRPTARASSSVDAAMRSQSSALACFPSSPRCCEHGKLPHGEAKSPVKNKSQTERIGQREDQHGRHVQVIHNQDCSDLDL